MSSLLKYSPNPVLGLALVLGCVIAPIPAEAEEPRPEHEVAVPPPVKLVLPNLFSYPNAQAAEGPTWSRPAAKILPTGSLRFDPPVAGVWRVNQSGAVMNCTTPCAIAVAPGVVNIEAFDGNTLIARREVTVAGDEMVILAQPGVVFMLMGGLFMVGGGIFGLVAGLGEKSQNDSLWGGIGVVFGVSGLVMLARGLVMDPAIVLRKPDGNVVIGALDRTPSPRPWIGFSSAGLGAGVTF